MGAVVTKDVKDNEVVTGNFAIPHKQFIEIEKYRRRDGQKIFGLLTTICSP